MALLLPVSAAHIAAIQPNNNDTGRLCRRLLRRLDEVLLQISVPTRSVLFRTVPAFCAPLIGSNSDRKAATLPKGTNAAYRAVT